MATFETRVRRDGKTSVRAKIRLKGARVSSASFTRLTDARRWAQQTEVAIQEGRYFKDAAAKRHTLAEAVDRYTVEVLPRKPRSTSIQARQLAVKCQEVLSGLSKATDRCHAADSLMRAMPVVVMNPTTEHGGALRGRLVGDAIGPLAQC